MMATVLPRPVPPHRSSSTLASSYQSIDSLTSPSTPCQLPVPNKHIPVCPPGPAPDASDIPPQVEAQSSLLHPPNNFARLESGNITIFKIDAAGVAAALDHISRQPLPEPSQVFPWFHGLHPNNHIQQAFFIQRRRALRRTPECLRSITVVKADGDLSISRLKGAIAPHEFLNETNAEFLEVDPREGFSVRNFQIQAAKTAMTSDVIVYGDDEAQVRTLGWKISTAQSNWRNAHHDDLPVYNTFICTSPFGEFETRFDDIVAVDSTGQVTGKVVDFFHQERREMYAMTQASEISHNVWVGPTPEVADEWDVLIECSDLGRLNPAPLEALSKTDGDTPVCLDFPSSGSILPPTWSHTEADGILETCKWIYHISHGTRPSLDEDDNITACKPRKILIHCADGYTESTMLGIAYFSYSTGRPVPEAWLTLHTVKKRNFFAYPTDVALLTAIAPRLLHESPICANRSLSDITAVINDEPKWLASLDGSFPSRILDYMYLGNLGHANNPDLLKALGITQILSVGETAMWPDGKLDEWGEDNICLVQGVQDNGIDPLTEEFARCLEFIDHGRRNGTATLVHCRVGVSRSATICIAEVMRSLHLSFPRAYCFVRARRLNVIIQPHLRFAYELLKWEEVLQGDDIKRELEWGEIAREVALMNRPYAR